MKKYHEVVAFSGAIITWLAVIIQAALMIENRDAPIGETLIRFFSFFTILSNIIVAICFSANALRKKYSGFAFFSMPSVQTAVAVYILIVGLIYNVILRFIWEPTGLQQIVDEILHSVVPLLYLAYWAFYVEKTFIPFKHIFYWMIYPLVYLAGVLARGSSSGFYPYPFLDVTFLGYHKVAINGMLILILILFLSFLFIIVSRTLARPRQDTKTENNRLPL
jgi:hypothetical protein